VPNNTLITINLVNNSPNTERFFFFQAPSVYVGGGDVYSNSILSYTLTPHSVYNSSYTFQLLLQYYAGAQQAHGVPQVGQPSGYGSATTAIGLTPNPDDESTNNCTTMAVTPSVGLTNPVYKKDVQAGAFRIETPVFDSNDQHYNAGSAVTTHDGSVVLSNFVQVRPNDNLDCQPVLIFYVQTGDYAAGQVMNFTNSSRGAGKCDATTGTHTFQVSYDSFGKFTVTPKRLVADERGMPRLINADLATNTIIYNEAGTGELSRGFATGHAVPFWISGLTQPERILPMQEYQVRVKDQQLAGRLCLKRVGDTAQFGG
jgi:hypothetical protein